MSDTRVLLANPVSVGPKPVGKLGCQLIETGKLSTADLARSLVIKSKTKAPLNEILVTEGYISPELLLDTVARRNNIQRIDLAKSPPRASMAKALPASVCLQHEILPWLWSGNILFVATSDPAAFEKFKQAMTESTFTFLPVIASSHEIRTQISRLYGYQLAQHALTHVSHRESCRNWGTGGKLWTQWPVYIIPAALAVFAYHPVSGIVAMLLWAVLTLILTMLIKGAGFVAQIMAAKPDHRPRDMQGVPLPRISVIVPLYHEHEIASSLIKRLKKLTYPKSLMEVILVLEAADEITRNTIKQTQLPPWMSMIEVPDCQGPTTKPRALNYALDFCRGSIIGIWDAEDAPESDQLEKVAARFHTAAKNVACLQGILDYYNPAQNWLSRCFTIEYATWWRVVLPGMARLGFTIPLGGTTLFFKRDILEKLGRWDAHNVTEDADLGVRLARHGYVTELLPTVTYEEANCRMLPWIRQRSRWLKGFMITYCVHMRNPLRLLRELGFKSFMGLQMIFLATFSQFALAPVLWSFWMVFFDLGHPAQSLLSESTIRWITLLFFTSELLNIMMGMSAVSGPRHRHLMKWVVSMPLYFVLAAFAAYKALYEMLIAPFYWDKTQHGLSEPE